MVMVDGVWYELDEDPFLKFIPLPCFSDAMRHAAVPAASLEVRANPLSS